MQVTVPRSSRRALGLAVLLLKLLPTQRQVTKEPAEAGARGSPGQEAWGARGEPSGLLNAPTGRLSLPLINSFL